MIPRFIVFLMLLLFSSGAYAMLPHDAEFRQRDILIYRQNKMYEYEQEQKKHEASMVSIDRQVRQALAAPPGVRTLGAPVLSGGEISRPAGSLSSGSGRSARRWIISIISLLFIGTCVWWVRISTGEPHETER